MTEFIINIEEVSNIIMEDNEYSYLSYDGYRVKTNRQEILLLIDNGQNCCEDWGYFWTNDNINEFIFRQLIEITVTDTSLNTTKIDDIFLDEGDTMFVNLVTDVGVLQFTAYNAHNGYYGHRALLVSKQLTHSERL